MSGLITCLPWRLILADTGYGLFNGQGNNLLATVRYGFADNAQVFGTSIGVARGQYGCTIGNISSGLFCGGYGSGTPYLASCDRYTYASNVVVGGIMMSGTKAGASGISDGVAGYVFGGFTGSAFLLNVDRFAYSGGTFSRVSDLSVSSYEGYGLNGPDYGIFVIDGKTTSIKYTYATDVRTAGSSALVNRVHPAIIGTKSAGCAVYGSTTLASRLEYAFASGTASTVSTLGTKRVSVGGASNSTSGVMIGGASGLTTITLFDFGSSTAIDSGGYLNGPTSMAMGISSMPGHL